jgi:7-carboxy-7-deazaguanine synthase
MSYSVKEIFYTLQGEGANAGRSAVFCRFSGCNLWSGREQDRSTAVCQFCDTDFVGTDGLGGGKFGSAKQLSERVWEMWPTIANAPHPVNRPLVVCTGGEPLLQIDEPLISALHAFGFEVAIETNGTLLPPPGIDWICVSPKAGTRLQIRSGTELKLVFPQAQARPEKFTDLDFRHFFLQPMDGTELEQNTRLAVEYCLAHPEWRLSLQTHKMLGIR